MEAEEVEDAVTAAMATARELGLAADDAVVLHVSNRAAVRLLPCDSVARVTLAGADTSSAMEVDLARRLADAGAPVVPLDPRVEPRVYGRGGFTVTLWSYHEPWPPREIAPLEYAEALARLHEGLRDLDIETPRFTDRVAEAEALVNDPALTPDLDDAGRALLAGALRSLSRSILARGRPEQLLHGEPHPGNLLRTEGGLRFIDWETACRGPIEFDIAHCARPPASDADVSWLFDAGMPEAVGAHYPGADLDMVRECWVLVLAMVAAWRWDRNDRFPNGRRMGLELLGELRAATGRYGLDIGA